MQWFIVSRDMHVLCAPSTKAPNSISIYNDKQTISITNNAVVSTYEFTIDQKHPDAKYFLLGNYIAFRDKYGDTKLYTMKEHHGDDLQQTWMCEDIGMDLINATADKWDYSKDPHPIAWYYENLVLKDTGWTLGVNEISNLSRGLSFDGQSDTLLTRAGDIANQFGGAEINFTVEMSGSQVISQNVNIYKKIGSGATKEKFIDQKNLTSLNYNGTIDNLCTSLIGYGGTPESTGDNTSEKPPIDISDLAYDDGQFWTVKGDKHLYDRISHKTWTRFRAYYDSSSKSTDGYINGIFTYDTTDPQELLNRMITELKSRNHPSETYEATLLKLGADIGDYIQIAHNNYNPPIYLSARVQQVENCYTAEGQDIGILGDYTRMQSNIDPRVQQLIDGLANSVKYNYTWIRYAKDDKGTDMTATPTTNTKYVAIVSNKPTGVPSDNPADYVGHWQLIQGQDGSDGIPGPKGEDGRTSYTHFAYANNVSGTEDFSVDNPTGRSYMGVYSDFTKADSTNPSDYVWSYTKGETGPEGMQGAQGPKGDVGIPGKPGIDGKTPYTHVAYADNDEGGGFSQSPDNKAYMGWYSDYTETDSTEVTKYAWSLIKGADGKDGADGVAGKDGVGVKTTTITYTQSTSGTTPPTTGWTANVPTLIKGQYLWTKTVWTYTDSSVETGYTVSYNAKDGNTGSDGRAGKDGVGIKSTTITYQSGTSGTVQPTGTWVSSPPSVPGGNYLWTRTVWSYTDGTNETGYSVAKAGEKGEQGLQGLQGYKGDQGIQGPKGADGKSSYTHIAYADSATGEGFSQQPDGKTFIGMYVDFEATDSTDVTKYNWSLVKGEDGSDGTPGKPGADGKTPYFHIAYADSADGKNGFYAGGGNTNLWDRSKAVPGYLNGAAGGINPPDAENLVSDFISVDENQTYVYSTNVVPTIPGKLQTWDGYVFFDSNKTQMGGRITIYSNAVTQGVPQHTTSVIKVPVGASFIRIGSRYLEHGTAKLEKGSVATPWSPAPSEAHPTYMGTYTDYTQADSLDPTVYSWSLIKGADGVDGADGAPGKPGADGRTPYFHQAWADSKDGKTNFSITDPTNRGYLGTYTDFTQADSTDPTKYFWVELVGAIEVGGRNLLLGTRDFSSINIQGHKVAVTNGQETFQAATGTQGSGATYDIATFNGLTLEKNTDYTASFWAKTSENTDIWSYLYDSGSNGNYSDGSTKNQTTTDYTRFVVHFHNGNNTATPRFIPVRIQKPGVTVWVYGCMLERGNKATDWSPAPEDTQGQIDSINQGLRDTNNKIASVTKVDSQATAPTNPKKGDQWWVKDANGNINAFKIWDGTKWADSIIQQSAMNIGTLNGNIINGATINTSDFNMSFDQTNAIDGVNKKGTTTIENGQIKTDFQIKNTTQTGYVHLTPEGLSTGSTNPNGTLQNSVGLAFGQINLATTITNASGVRRLVRGSLDAEDMEKSLTTYWESGDVGNRQKFWAYKQFRRVVLTGVILLPAAKFGTGGNGYRTIFNITDTSLRPLTTRWVKCSSFGDIPHLGLLEFRPNGDVVAIGVPSQGRYSFEGESYAIENL